MRRVLFTLMALLTVGSAFAQSQCNASFTWTPVPSGNNLLNVGFTNTSTFSFPPAVWTYVNSTISYGDNSTSSISNSGTNYHNYAAPGTYTVILTTMAYDSTTQALLCTDADTQQVTVAYSACAFTLSSVSNGGGSYTFTVNNPAATAGLTYSWNFGDGGTASGSASSQTHTYATAGNYTVTVVSSGGGCTYTNTTSVQNSTGPLNCNQLVANFSYNQSSGGLVYFTNTSTTVNAIPPVKRVASWDFGDGSAPGAGNNTSHTYSTGGTYNVTLYNQWVDTVTLTVYCMDTITKTVNVTISAPVNAISGYVIGDSLNNPAQVSFKVWLITHNATTNSLTAVDSQVVSGFMFAPYSFPSYPAGTYYTKAALLNGTPGNFSLVPTYHTASLYWATATPIVHNGQSSSNRNIVMQQGMYTSGPGFIGGNISLGANKGTNVGAPNLLVLLRNSAAQLIKFTYTDANGDYSFGSLPAGTYNVYPEEMNYLTTPSSAIVLASGQYTVSGVNFKQTPTEIKPISTGINNINTVAMFSVYPNPASGNVTLTWSSSANGKAALQVIDMAGRQVYSSETDMSKSTAINLATLQSGIYFIKVTTDKGQYTEKIILQN